MFEGVRYKNNYLSEVIVRVDWLVPVQQIEKKLPRGLTQTAKKAFPIAEPINRNFRAIQISPEGVVEQKTEFTEWNFHDRNRSKTLTISNTSLFIKYTGYDNFEGLKADFVEVVNEFFKEFKETQASRLGLRYVNNIEISEPEPLQWNEYIDDKLLGLFHFYPQEEFLSRVFHILEFNFGESSLKYQFGLHNPDYPAPIRRKVFVLDLDAYYPGIQERDDVLANLDVFHGKIQEIFEMSITERLRRRMNG